MFDAVEDQKIGEGKGHDIHQPVVLKPEPANFNYDRAYMLRQVLPPVPELAHKKLLSTPFRHLSQ
jgi:hypothetical protein